VTAPGKAGHAEVVAEVVKQRRLVRAVLLSCGAPVERIDDLAQVCMLVAWRAIREGRFNPPDPEKPLPDAVVAWLSGIASRIAIDARRAHARYARTFQETETEAHPIDIGAILVPSVERVVMARDELAVFARAKLSTAHHEVVVLAAQGYTAREIGEKLGIPEDTAATRLRRARRAFEEALVRWRR
jgi:RNA polymerase sigma-70 factor (ECF subfamily)